MGSVIDVLIVIDNLGTGGAQEYIYQQLRRLVHEAVRFSVCALRSGGVYKAKIEALGIPVVVLSPTPSIANIPLAIVNLVRLLRTRHYDVIHTFLQASFAIATPLAYLVRRATIHTIVAVRGQTEPWYFPLMAVYQPLIAAYLSFHPPQLIEAGVRRSKIKAVEVTVDLADLVTIAHDPYHKIQPYDLVGAYPVALSVGRLHRDKGHEYAIRAWPTVLREYPNARLLIVGDGDDETRLKTLAEQHGVCGAIIFTGYCSDLRSLFTRADLFLRPSVNEGVNLITIQAMAAGLPAIGFKTAVPKEIIMPDVNGLLVPLADVDAFAQAICCVCRNRSKSQILGQMGRSRVAMYYDITKVTSFYMRLYQAICEKQHLASLPDMIAAPWPFGQGSTNILR